MALSIALAVDTVVVSVLEARAGAVLVAVGELVDGAGLNLSSHDISTIPQTMLKRAYKLEATNDPDTLVAVVVLAWLAALVALARLEIEVAFVIAFAVVLASAARIFVVAVAIHLSFAFSKAAADGSTNITDVTAVTASTTDGPRNVDVDGGEDADRTRGRGGAGGLLRRGSHDGGEDCSSHSRHDREGIGPLHFEMDGEVRGRMESSRRGQGILWRCCLLEKWARRDGSIYIYTHIPRCISIYKPLRSCFFAAEPKSRFRTVITGLEWWIEQEIAWGTIGFRGNTRINSGRRDINASRR